MPWYFIVLLLLGSCFLLSWLSSRLIKSLVQIAKFLRWREFIIAFFIIALASSLPNLFVDLNAVLQGKPQLAFGDIVGGNLVDLTIILAIAVFFSKKGISAESSMVQTSALFTTLISIMPLFLILDGRMGRMDGLMLLAAFVAYFWWIFSNKDHFKKNYKGQIQNPIKSFKNFLWNLLKIAIFLVLLLVASQAVIVSADFFSQSLGVSLSLVGILLLGIGNSFPETYFAIISAKRQENWMVLGDLMGSVIICSTLVLGIVALLVPFEIHDLSTFFIARVFLLIAALVSLLFIKTGRKITKKEGLILLIIYITFLLVEVFAQSPYFTGV